MSESRPWIFLGMVLISLFSPSIVHAGGSGLNVVVIVNQASSNSVELGNYYCEKRQVPPNNVLRINWAGPNTLWTSNDFQNILLNPLLSMLATRQITNQIDYIVLSMDIPIQTSYDGVINGTTSAIFYGLKTETGPSWISITNSYFASERAFADSRPESASGPSFLAVFITSDSLDNAKKLIDHGCTSDGTFPSQPILLAKSSDSMRNFRYRSFDNAIFNTRLAGNPGIVRTNMDSPSGITNLMGFETGMYQFTISPNTFVPGAIADSLTSFGGIIFGPNDHTTLLALINAGASGSYGTVTEPSPVTAKFPDPQVYFYQARGFNIAEAYYQSIFEPYEGIVVAEPLASPFAVPATGSWVSISPNAVVTGTTSFNVRFDATDARHPLQRVDLFVDGMFFQTLTNVQPRAGNVIKLTLNGWHLNYTVPANATLGSMASDLAASLNSTVATNATKTVAWAHGDRVELRSLATSWPVAPGIRKIKSATGSAPTISGAPLSITNSAGSASGLTTYLSSPRGMFLNSTAAGNKTFSISGTLQVGTWLKLTVKKSRASTISVTATNQDLSAQPYDLLGKLAGLIATDGNLQGRDGVLTEDLRAGFFGTGSVVLRARQAGLPGAVTRVTLTSSGNLVVAPATEVALDDNLADTSPRNHLYVCAGVTNLNLNFSLNTIKLSDGFHELTAVAYEGTHVRTQTRASLPIVVKNSSLDATLASADLAATNSVTGAYHLQVTANSANVTAIHLFSTGGELGFTTNQSTSSFSINGADLGVGLHPFYAVVETSTGQKFRTTPLWARFIPGN